MRSVDGLYTSMLASITCILFIYWSHVHAYIILNKYYSHSITLLILWLSQWNVKRTDVECIKPHLGLGLV